MVKKEQNQITLDRWEEQYYIECRDMGIREGKTHKYGTLLFKFNSINDLRKFIPKMNDEMIPKWSSCKRAYKNNY